MRNTKPRISSRLHRAWLAAALVALQVAPVACAGSPKLAGSHIGRNADALTDFRRRVDQYVELHNRLQQEGLPAKPTTDVGQNQASQQALAERIRAARRDARPGEIFTPIVAAKLRASMNPQLRGAPAAGTRASIRDDAPARFALRVNRAYPDGASLPTVPPNVLRILPPLPEGLDYRILDTHLILHDVDADIVVDYILNVMCARC